MTNKSAISKHIRYQRFPFELEALLLHLASFADAKLHYCHHRNLSPRLHRLKETKSSIQRARTAQNQTHLRCSLTANGTKCQVATQSRCSSILSAVARSKRCRRMAVLVGQRRARRCGPWGGEKESNSPRKGRHSL